LVRAEPSAIGPGNLKAVRASSPASDLLSKDLKRRGFRFVGTTICYAFMQAVGMVNDHLVSCFRYRALAGSNHQATPK
jgi:DNA-3-methyladenine glycosylase I